MHKQVLNDIVAAMQKHCGDFVVLKSVKACGPFGSPKAFQMIAPRLKKRNTSMIAQITLSEVRCLSTSKRSDQHDSNTQTNTYIHNKLTTDLQHWLRRVTNTNLACTGGWQNTSITSAGSRCYHGIKKGTTTNTH